MISAGAGISIGSMLFLEVKMNEITWKRQIVHLMHPIGLRRRIVAYSIVRDGFGGCYAYLSETRRIHIPKEMIVGIEEIVEAKSRVISRAKHIALTTAGVLFLWLVIAAGIKASWG
jgi:hypothetical protein